MATVSKSFTLLEKPEAIWAVLVDFPRWDRMLHVHNAAERGWGDRFIVLNGNGVGARLAMTTADQELYQEWEVEECAFPSRLRMASRKCNGYAMTQMRSAFDFTITPVSAGETKVDIKLEGELSDPFWSLFFFWLPTKMYLRPVLERFERGLVAALSG